MKSQGIYIEQELNNSWISFVYDRYMIAIISISKFQSINSVNSIFVDQNFPSLHDYHSRKFCAEIKNGNSVSK